MNKRFVLKKLLLLFILTLYFFNSYACLDREKITIDSLLKVADFQKVHDSIRVKYYNKAGKFYFNLNPTKGLECVKKAIDIASRINYKSGLARAYDLNGAYFDNLGDYIKGLEMTYKAMQIIETTNDHKALANINNNAGVIYFRQRMYDEALQFYFNSLNIARKNNLKDVETIFLLNIGEVYYKSGNLDSALIFENQALELSLERNQLENAAYCYGIIGLIDLEKNNFIESKFNLQKAIELFKNQKDNFAISEYYYHLSEYYLKINKIDSSIISVDECIKNAKEISAKEWIKNGLYLKSALLEKNKKYKDALKIHQEANFIADSLLDENKQKRIAQLTAIYQSEKKQEEINALLKTQNEKDLEIEFQKKINFYTQIAATIIFILLFVVLFFINKLMQANRIIKEQNKESNKLLLNILPEKVAIEIKSIGKYTPRYYENVSIIFADFVNFTTKASTTPDFEIVNELDSFFIKFDEICEKNNLEKIKTIGDCYMAVGGLPVENTSHAYNAVNAALQMLKFSEKRNWQIRIGIHTGPVVAGVIGKHKFAYDIWGHAVNTAARLEQSAETNKINISKTTFEIVKNDFECELRGQINARNMGSIEMYYIKT